jgi:hypothetical protein
MKGSNIRSGFKAAGARIIDLAPTILYLMDAAVPADMDGRVLEEVISPKYFQQNPPRYTQPPLNGGTKPSGVAYSEEESSKIEERLRSLGYIE